MLLRQLNDVLPALCRGFESPETEFEPYAAQIGRELEWLRTHPVQIELSGLCPMDFFLLFRPDRRTAVFSGGAVFFDWQWAAAVRLTELLTNIRPTLKADVFDSRLRDWRCGVLLREGSGLPGFVRTVFCGLSPADERHLTEPAVIHGAKLKRFLAEGSTSLVYLADFHGRECVVKIPVAGGESRFRNELEWLRRMKHPNLPEIFACDSGDSPYCVMEWCHTGRGIGKQGRTSGFFQALDYLHRRFVLHGDIRWSNLGLRNDGSPVLLDFSHARHVGNCFSAGEADAETQKLKCLLT